MPELEFAQKSEGAVQIVEVAGRLDHQTSAEFDRQLIDLAGSRVVLDLASLEYVSSAGLRSVLGALKRSNAAGGKLALAAPRASIREVFEISGFITLIPVHSDRAGAVAALR